MARSRSATPFHDETHATGTATDITLSGSSGTSRFCKLQTDLVRRSRGTA
jgi:hypothetical protein